MIKQRTMTMTMTVNAVSFVSALGVAIKPRLVAPVSLSSET